MQVALPPWSQRFTHTGVVAYNVRHGWLLMWISVDWVVFAALPLTCSGQQNGVLLACAYVLRKALQRTATPVATAQTIARFL